MQFNESILTNAFTGLPFTVNGVGRFVLNDGKPVVAKRVDNAYQMIGLNDGDNSGYLRATGDTTYTANGEIDCSTQIYEATDEIALVIGTNKYTIESITEAMLYRIANISGATFKRFIDDRDKIITEEKMMPNTLNLIKILFDYKYDWVAPCEENIICECSS